MATSVERAEKAPDDSGKIGLEADRVKAGTLFHNLTPPVIYRQHFTPESSHLLYLTCGEFEIFPAATSREFRLPGEESLLFMWQGTVTAWVGEQSFELSPYDTLYIPSGASFRMRNTSAGPARVVQCSAPAAKEHLPFHSKFADFSKQENRIRHLKGKDVYMMFDVSEGADKLVAGYTFFQPNQRSWPPPIITPTRRKSNFLSKGTVPWRFTSRQSI
jgi:quercetin dioxygenase-like cupin family protein